MGFRVVNVKYILRAVLNRQLLVQRPTVSADRERGTLLLGLAVQTCKLIKPRHPLPISSVDASRLV